MLDGISKSLINTVTNVLDEKKSGDKEAYQKFFDKALKKYGVNSPDELSTEKKKEFFNYVDKNWKGDDEQQKEELEKDSDDPCWKGYVQLGTKKKDGKEVPNCVPKEEAEMAEADLEEARRQRRLSADEKKAMELGKKAFKAGKERAAMMGDKELQKLGGSTSVGLDVSTPKGKKLAMAWFNGWDTANFNFTELLGEVVKEEADDDDDDNDDGDENDLDEKKMTAAAKRKAAKYRQKNKQSLKKYRKKYNRDINRGTRKVNKQRSKSMRKSRAKSGFSEDVELDEKAVSQSQQKLMGMAYALKKGDMDRGEASDEVQRIADTMSLSDLKDFASTEHDDLPTKIETADLVKDLEQLNEKFDFKGSKIRNPYNDWNGAVTALSGLATMVVAGPLAVVVSIFSGVLAKLIILLGFAAWFVFISGLGGVSVGRTIEEVKQLLASKKITASDVRQMRKSAREVREALLKNPELKGYRGAITRFSNELQAAFDSGDKMRVFNSMEELRGYLRSLDKDAYDRSLGEEAEIQESSDDDMKDLAREIDDIDEIPNSIKQSLKNGELPSKRDVQTIDSEWAQDALLVSLSELLGAKNVEKMYGMKVINPDAL